MIPKSNLQRLALTSTLAAVALLLAAACTRGDESRAPVPSPTIGQRLGVSPTSVVTPNPSPIATALATASPTERAPAALPRAVLVMDGDEVVRIGTDGTPTIVASSLGDARRIVDDLGGGIVFERDGAIVRRAAGTAFTQTLASVGADHEAGAQLRLLSVDSIGEAATLLYVVGRQLPGTQNAEEWLWALDLETTEPRRIALVGGWESGPHAVSYGGRMLVLPSAGEGLSYVQFLDLDGTRLALAPALAEATKDCFSQREARCTEHASLSPDGASIALLQRLANGGLEVALLDVASGAEMARADLSSVNAVDGLWFDGAYALVRTMDGGVFLDLTSPSPAVSELVQVGRVIGLASAHANAGGD